MIPAKNFDFIVKSAIIRGEKPTSGIQAIAAANPNQMNRITGYLLSGEKIVVAQRHGKGGMDFNKLLSGKVYAVAADGLSPVYEKDEAGKPTKIQKKENGLPLYSSSGFYLLSSKEYPAIRMMEAYTLLRNNGDQVWFVTEEQIQARKKFSITNKAEFDSLLFMLETIISDDQNIVAPFDVEINKKRNRDIQRAKDDANDAGEKYEGVNFSELSVSKKDGNPFALFCWQVDEGDIKKGVIVRAVDIPDEANDDGRTILRFYTSSEAVKNFIDSFDGKSILKALSDGKKVTFAVVQGHCMRTSVSFRRKIQNVLSGAASSKYGDAVYILASLKGWTKGIVSLMFSKHPNFPNADYDAHYYVAACRQAEVGMNKKEDGPGWGPPEGIHYSISSKIMK